MGAHIRASLRNVGGTLVELSEDILPRFCETLLIVGRSLDYLALQVNKSLWPCSVLHVGAGNVETCNNEQLEVTRAYILPVI